MKNIVNIIAIALTIILFANCNQQNIQDDLNLEIAKRTNLLIDSLNNACEANYQDRLDVAVAQAIAVVKKANKNANSKVEQVKTPVSKTIQEKVKISRPGINKRPKGETSTKIIPNQNPQKIKPTGKGIYKRGGMKKKKKVN